MQKTKATPGRNARKAGQIVRSGKEERSIIRWRRTKGKEAPAIIGNSLSAITFGTKTGFEVFFTLLGINPKENYEQMFNDLWECYKAATKALTGEVIKMHPINDVGLSIGSAMHYLMERIKTNIVPKYAEFNIDKNEHHNRYYITIYRACPYPTQWHVIQVKHVLTYLAKENIKLHDLFVEFIVAFSRETGIEFWYEDLMAYSLEWLEENIQQYIDDEDDVLNTEDYNKMVFDLNDYRCGTAAYYQQLFNKTKTTSPKTILSKLNKLNSRSNAAKIIKLGCALMLTGYNIYDYNYQPDLNADDENDDYRLRWVLQQNIVWDISDNVTTRQEEFLDNSSQEGIDDPVAVIEIHPATTTIDFKQFEKSIAMPQQFSEFNEKVIELLKYYERKD